MDFGCPMPTLRSPTSGYLSIGVEPQQISNNQLADFPSGLEWLHLADTANARGLVGQNLAHAQARPRKPDRTLARPTQPGSIKMKRQCSAEAIGAEAGENVGITRAE